MTRRLVFTAPALTLARVAAAWPLAPMLAVTLLLGCVTINIYFPAAAAERAADRIIKEILEAEEGIELPPDARRGGAMPLPLARLAVLLPTAQAQRQRAVAGLQVPALGAVQHLGAAINGAGAPALVHHHAGGAPHAFREQEGVLACRCAS